MGRKVKARVCKLRGGPLHGQRRIWSPTNSTAVFQASLQYPERGKRYGGGTITGYEPERGPQVYRLARHWGLLRGLYVGPSEQPEDDDG